MTNNKIKFLLGKSHLLRTQSAVRKEQPEPATGAALCLPVVQSSPNKHPVVRLRGPLFPCLLLTNISALAHPHAVFTFLTLHLHLLRQGSRLELDVQPPGPAEGILRQDSGPPSRFCSLRETRSGTRHRLPPHSSARTGHREKRPAAGGDLPGHPGGCSQEEPAFMRDLFPCPRSPRSQAFAAPRHAGLGMLPSKHFVLRYETQRQPGRGVSLPSAPPGAPARGWGRGQGRDRGHRSGWRPAPGRWQRDGHRRSPCRGARRSRAPLRRPPAPFPAPGTPPPAAPHLFFSLSAVIAAVAAGSCAASRAGAGSAPARGARHGSARLGSEHRLAPEAGVQSQDTAEDCTARPGDGWGESGRKQRRRRTAAAGWRCRGCAARRRPQKVLTLNLGPPPAAGAGAGPAPPARPRPGTARPRPPMGPARRCRRAPASPPPALGSAGPPPPLPAPPPVPGHPLTHRPRDPPPQNPFTFRLFQLALFPCP